MASNRKQTHKTISRWQLLELIALGSEAGLPGTQIRQILASEYGINPDYTSRLLVEFVQKGYVVSQPAPPTEGGKGGRPRKVYIRTEKANDLPEKPLPRDTALAAPSGLSAQEPLVTRDTEPHQEEIRTAPLATPPTPPETKETTPATGTKRRRSRRPLEEAVTPEAAAQQTLPMTLPETVGADEVPLAAASAPAPTPPIPADADMPAATLSEPALAPDTPPSAAGPTPEFEATAGTERREEEAQEVAPAPQATQPRVAETTPLPPPETTLAPVTKRRRGPRPIEEAVALEAVAQPTRFITLPKAATPSEAHGATPPEAAAPLPAQASQPSPEEPPALAESVLTHRELPPSSATPSLEAPAPAPSGVHEALAAAMDQFSDLLLLQVAHKLGAFVANQMAPLERATGELCAQIEVLHSRLNAITQQLGTVVTTPVPPLQHERTAATGESTSADMATPPTGNTAASGRGPAFPPGQGRVKSDKKSAQTWTEQLNGVRPTLSGPRKLKALLIGVPFEQEQPLRERFGSRYELMFLGAEAKFGKVRAIKDRYQIVLGLEDTCSPAVKDALKGHPHKAILPHPAQLMDELEEYFQLHLEQSPTGAAG